MRGIFISFPLSRLRCFLFFSCSPHKISYWSFPLNGGRWALLTLCSWRDCQQHLEVPIAVQLIPKNVDPGHLPSVRPLENRLKDNLKKRGLWDSSSPSSLKLLLLSFSSCIFLFDVYLGRRIWMHLHYARPMQVTTSFLYGRSSAFCAWVLNSSMPTIARCARQSAAYGLGIATVICSRFP